MSPVNPESGYEPYLLLAIRMLQNDAEGIERLPEPLRLAGEGADLIKLWRERFTDPEEAEFEALQLIDEALGETPLMPILIGQDSPAWGGDSDAAEQRLAGALQAEGYPALCTSLFQSPESGYDITILIAVAPASREQDEEWVGMLSAWLSVAQPERVIVLSDRELPNGLDQTDPIFRLVGWEREEPAERVVARVIHAFLQRELAYRKPPRLVSDSIEGEDLIGVRKDAAALSRLVCEESVDLLPLAIAIFGKWGSGKSFFMREMDTAIKRIARRRFSDENGRPKYANEQYVRITFNAWHYVESNLWASLASHIFENLYQSSEDDAEASRREEVREREHLLEELDKARQAKDRAADDIAKAKSNRWRALQNFRQSRAEEETAKSVVERIESGLWAIPEVWREFPDTERRELANTFVGIDPKLRDLVAEAGGLNEIGKRLEDLERFGRTLVRMSGKRFWWTVGLAATVALSFGALAQFGNSLLGSLGFFLGPTGTFLVSGLHLWKQAGESVEAFRRKFAAVNRGKLDEWRRRLEESRKAVADNEQQLEQWKAKVRDIEERIENTYSLKRLINFLQDRAAGQDYTRHLGLLALLRRDFETLERLMREASEENARDPAKLVRDGGDRPLQPIRRVILFIDDLDRCPPKRVVEVLQAIHLLLAFPLFVVVVGVDSR